MTKFALFGFVLCLLIATPSVAQDSGATSKPKIEKVVTDFDQPFLFAYLTWEGKVRAENGVASIRDTNNRGGAGFSDQLDLSSFLKCSPAVRVRIGKKNQMQHLRWFVEDSEQRQAAWRFPIGKQGDAKDEWVWIIPELSASVGNPNETNPDKPGLPDFSKITQWQLSGDWMDDVPADLEIDQIVLIAPTQAMLEQQKQLLDQQNAARQQMAQEREQLRSRLSKVTKRSPRVVHISSVAPDVICIEVQAGELIPAKLEQYAPQAGDQRNEQVNDANDVIVELIRDGRTIGNLIGPDRQWLATWESVAGDPLLDFVADTTATYGIQSNDDSGYAQSTLPTAVYRKSKVTVWAQGSNETGVQHSLFLRLPKPLVAGKTYQVTTKGLNIQTPQLNFKFDAAKNRSPAVHVHQIGYRPSDPVKRAFVSCWLGTGGALKLPPEMRFVVIDDNSNKKVFDGMGRVLFPAERAELMARDANFNGTDVAQLDFSEFQQAGKFRIAVEGVGCSYPFEINRDAWTAAFQIQMRGLFHNRSGMALSSPFSDFEKPRDMHPADGYPAFYTTYRAVEEGGEAWAKIVGGDTGKPAPQAWGGYHDAGDWNPRRVTHMRVTMAMLELFEMFPEHFTPMQWNIPKTGSMPDLISEANWEFSCFRRLQYENGGVGYGIESKGDPAPGEVSWLNSYPSYVLAADYDSSWFYAAVGARLSRLIEPYDSTLAADYRQSSVKAFEFAEQDFQRDQTAGLTDSRDSTWESIDRRNLAALELYRLTKDDKYHRIFLENTVLNEAEPNLFQWTQHNQRDQAFAYCLLPQGQGDEKLKRHAQAGIVRLANMAIQYGDENAFGLTTFDKSKPQFLGFYSTPDASDLTRAHFLTGDERYLAAAVRATQFQSGCNPNNQVYMTGIGANPLQHVFKLDARQTGQAVPAGLVPYGNIDLEKWNHQGITWPITWHIGKDTVPDFYAWPTTEAYLDLGRWPMLEEFTVDAWTPNVQVWGYLSARK